MSCDGVEVARIRRFRMVQGSCDVGVEVTASDLYGWSQVCTMTSIGVKYWDCLD